MQLAVDSQCTGTVPSIFKDTLSYTLEPIPGNKYTVETGKWNLGVSWPCCFWALHGMISLEEVPIITTAWKGNYTINVLVKYYCLSDFFSFLCSEKCQDLKLQNKLTSIDIENRPQNEMPYGSGTDVTPTRDSSLNHKGASYKYKEDSRKPRDHGVAQIAQKNTALQTKSTPCLGIISFMYILVVSFFTSLFWITFWSAAVTIEA